MLFSNKYTYQCIHNKYRFVMAHYNSHFRHHKILMKTFWLRRLDLHLFDTMVYQNNTHKTKHLPNWIYLKQVLYSYYSHIEMFLDLIQTMLIHELLLIFDFHLININRFNNIC